MSDIKDRHDVAYDIVLSSLRELAQKHEIRMSPLAEEINEYITAAMGGAISAHRENGRMWDVSSDVEDLVC
jgi:hypothetical protein